MRALSIAAAMAIALLVSTASAQDLGIRGGITPIQDNGRFSIVFENDLFDAFSPTDRFYTNGIYLASDWRSPLIDKCSRWLAFGPYQPANGRAYVGAGFSHELHTPQTINPCGQRRKKPTKTEENSPEECLPFAQDWQDHYADRDRPFSAVWSFFITAQRYVHRGVASGTLTQYRPWVRLEGGGFGRDAGFGYEVQKNWHAFFNDVIGADGSLANTPRGWLLRENPDDSQKWPLVQVSAGFDLNLVRLQAETGPYLTPAGIELDARRHTRVGYPRNTTGVGLTLRLGFIPEHSATTLRLRNPDALQKSAPLYLEASADWSAVVTDATFGAFDRYTHVLDEYAFGARVKVFGARAGFSLNWQRVLFIDPLVTYPFDTTIKSPFHGYGRASLELTY